MCAETESDSETCVLVLVLCVYCCVVSQPFQPHLNGCAMAIIFTNAKKYMRWKCFWQYPDLIIASFVTFNHIVYFFLFLVTWRRFFCLHLSCRRCRRRRCYVSRQCFSNRKTVSKKKIPCHHLKFNSFLLLSTVSFVRSFFRSYIIFALRVDFSLLFVPHAYPIYISYSQLYTFYANTFLSSSWITRGRQKKITRKKVDVHHSFSFFLSIL